jgi:phosphatidate cytidylyltransferase
MSISPRLITRILSSVLIAPVFLFCLLYSYETFAGATAAAFLIALYEWGTMSSQAARKSRQVLMLLFGMIYITFAFYAFYRLRTMTLFESDQFGRDIVLSLVLCVWASDVGGYAMGKWFGGPKWVPSISPNKTWAGFIGALLFPVPMVWGIAMYMEGGHVFDRPLDMIHMTIWAMGVGFAGQIGDLIVSVFKRRVGVKDTGSIIPGHGGLLDRIDSMMLAALMTYVVMKVVGLMYT